MSFGLAEAKSVRMDKLTNFEGKDQESHLKDPTSQRRFSLSSRSFIVSRYDLYEGKFVPTEVAEDDVEAFEETLVKKIESTIPKKKSSQLIDYTGLDGADITSIDEWTPSIGTTTSSGSSSDDDFDNARHRIPRRKSAYDLPVEFQKMTPMKSTIFIPAEHRPSLFESLHPSGSKDSVVLSLSRSSKTIKSSWSLQTVISDRFTHLNPKFVKSVAEQRVSYEFVRNLALKKLFKDIRFMLLELLHAADGIEEVLQLGRQFRVFSWTKEDFLSRHRRSAIVWVDIIPKMMDERAIELLKFSQDINELQRLMELLVNAFSGEFEMEVDQLVELMEESYDYLKIYSNIDLELKNNKSIFLKLSRQLEDKIMKQEILDRIMRDAEIHNQVFDSMVIAPMEYRYQKNFMGAIEAQSLLYLENQEQTIFEQILTMRHKVSREVYCMQCALNAHYTDMESIKEKLTDHAYRFQEHMNTIENATNYVRHHSDKIRARELYLREQMDRFHEEIRQANLKSVDIEKRERRLDEELQAYLENLNQPKHKPNHKSVAKQKAKKSAEKRKN